MTRQYSVAKTKNYQEKALTSEILFETIKTSDVGEKYVGGIPKIFGQIFLFKVRIRVCDDDKARLQHKAADRAGIQKNSLIYSL